mmetsp:Transcript_10986/g.21510  ORF Transcript_10986/g.21510 Transcript_10986/m.21510 type:complete len:342 (+) Transcript_10986:412-1437(+)
MNDEHYTAKHKPKPNFTRWMLGLSSVSVMALGPLLVYLGYQAYSFGVEVLIVDKALMGMGGLVSLLGLLGLVGLFWRSNVLLVVYFYSALLCIIFLSVFAVGAAMMREDIVSWVDRNWEKLRVVVEYYNMEEFKTYVYVQIESLAAFSLTVDLLLLIGAVMAILLKGRQIRISLLPVLSLNLSVLGSALVAVSVYSRQHSTHTNIPVWTIYIFTLIGLSLVVLGVLGYYGAMTSNRYLVSLYAWLLTLASFALLAAGGGFLFYSFSVMEFINRDWNLISQALEEDGYTNIDREEYGSLIQMHFKFAGLFGLVTFCFVSVAFVGAVLQVRDLKRRAADRFWI